MHEAHERGSDEMKLEILQSYKQFMIFDETRFQVVGGQGKSYAVCNCEFSRMIMLTRVAASLSKGFLMPYLIV